jgi:O-antigen biosynthesis protein
MDAFFSDYEAIRKSGLFDAAYYLAINPDVAERNVDPLVHYLEEGAREGRDPHADFDTTFYLEQCRTKGEAPGNPLIHYLRIGAGRGFTTKPDGTSASSGIAANTKPTAAGGNVRLPVLVALESLGVIAGPDGASRLSASGWALANAPISEISLSMYGTTLGSATYGVARPDIARLYPDRPGSADCGFILAVDLPQRVTGEIEPLLVVHTIDGETGQRPLRIKVPPREVNVALVDPLAPVQSDAASERAAMELYIDAATVDPTGVMRIEGWVVCVAQIESVEVLLDDRPFGKAEFGIVRPDVEAERPDFPNAGFSGFRMLADIEDLGAGSREITISVAARGGMTGKAFAKIEIPAISGRAPIADPGLRYHNDESALLTSGWITLKGWALCASPVASIQVFLDGNEIGRAEIGLGRPDVGNLFPRFAHARRPGYAFAAQIDPPSPGEHVGALLITRGDGETHRIELPIEVGEGRALGDVAAHGEAERLLHLDLPRLIGGAAETPVRGSLEIAGWALARAGVDAIEIAVDGTPMAIADYGLRRLDLQAAFPDRDDALSGGFQALLPHRALPKGTHTVAVVLRDKTGKTTRSEFCMEVEEVPDDRGPWSLCRALSQAETDLAMRVLQRCGRQPSFLVMLPVGNGDGELDNAEATAASLAAQVYRNWHLVVMARANRDLIHKRLIDAHGIAGRAEVTPDLAAAELAALAATADTASEETFITLIRPGDELGVDALLQLALAAARDPDADFLYSDERRHDPGLGKIAAFFKPQWSPDLLLATNYIGRLWCMRAHLLRTISDAGEKLLRLGEHDLVLRCTEKAAAIRHVPAVLCEQPHGQDDGSADGRKAVARALARRDVAGSIRDGLVPGTLRVERQLSTPGKVSIIIPTCAAGGLIETCITTLRERTAYRDYEIVCIENIPAKDRKRRQWLRRHADRVITTKETFNWARFNNLAAKAATGRYLLFLNDDIEITDVKWLDVLVAEAQRPEVATVGPLLLYPDQRMQHAGMFLAAMGQARHAFRYAPADEPGYFGLALTQRNVIAVTGACLMTRRETFDALGGFDEAHGVINNDVDYCLRAWRGGQTNVYTPHARLIHHEAVSRAALEDDYDVAAFDSQWRGVFLAGDPFFSPHLAKWHDDFTIDDEPTRTSVIGAPVLSREAIRNILVVKLDHIGDCVIAFPAVRRLKEHFPQARISVLTSRASKPVWAFEPAVDQLIEFDFFHPRSALGQLDRSEEEWLDLADQLHQEQFDLAVDLRKHTETREVLQRSGARYLAGFDHRGQFAWLDIALEWAGDQLFARKRQWAGDDLVNLVDAIGAACADRRAVIVPQPVPPAGVMPGGGPVVWVHPTAGNDIKQWPIEYFALVIDQLIEMHSASIFLTGAPSDEPVAAELLRQLRHPESVTSMIGNSPLADLPALMHGAALFLGNDSGLKHIAAGLGIPTVGVHAGTLDPREWGPVGPSAVAIAREMVCAPCYLSKVEDCRRNLACLRQLEPGRVYEACARMLLLAGEMPARSAPE